MAAKCVRVGISLGSNLGDRGQAIQDAMLFLARLVKECGNGLFANSAIYETDPVDCAAGTPPFLNAFVELETKLKPTPLLHCLQQYERDQGRPQPQDRPRNAPRVVDLDIIYYFAFVSDDPVLTLPHPRAHQRRFVLAPLAELRPDLILPGQSKTVTELLAALPEEPRARKIDS